MRADKGLNGKLKVEKSIESSRVSDFRQESSAENAAVEGGTPSPDEGKIQKWGKEYQQRWYAPEVIFQIRF